MWGKLKGEKENPKIMSSSTEEAAEAIMICVDNSYWMGNTKSPMFNEQTDAIENYCNHKLKSHSLVGVTSMAPSELLMIPTYDIESIMKAVNGVWIGGGRISFERALSVAYDGFLPDLFKPMQKRIVFFVGCPVYLSRDDMCMLGRDLKDYNTAIDVITFGDPDPLYEKIKILNCFIDSANNKGNCNICVVPPESSISDAIQRSQIICPTPAEGGISSPPPSAGIVVYVKASSDATDDNTDCPFCQRVLLTLEQKKLVYHTTVIRLEKKPEWFSKTCTLPLIMFGDGTLATNSDNIVEMIEKKHPNTPLENPLHFFHLGLKILPKLLPFLKEDNNDTWRSLKYELDELEAHFSYFEGPYVNGKVVSAVDLSLAPKLYHLVEACKQFHGQDILKEFPKVLYYYQSVHNLESFQKTKPSADNVYQGWLRKVKACK